MSVLDARWSITAVASFEASHRLIGSERCFRDHGHHWTAEITVTAPEMERDGIPRGAEGLEKAWDTLMLEFDHRPLNDMLPGVVSTPLGLANYLFERITAEYPGTSVVRVSDGVVWGAKSRS